MTARSDRPNAAVGLITEEGHTFAGSLCDDVRLARSDGTIDQLHDAPELVGGLA